MSGSRNALYVLRLIWQGTSTGQRRSLSTAALARETGVNEQTASSSSVRLFDFEDADTTDSGPSTPSFLEPESSEYKAVSLTLPPASYHPEPIQWPTLFPHQPAAHAGHRQKMCNPLYRLVLQEHYDDALRVLDELQSHGQAVQHRHAYLEPMLQALKGGKKAEALRWFSVYPNRPATANHPELKSIWGPTIHLLVTDRKGILADDEFLSEFLTLAGKKGLLPTLLPPILPHLAFSVPAHRSRSLLERCISSYVQSTTSNESESSRALYQMEIVQSQVGHWWASYLRKLVMAGWEKDARALFADPPAGVSWDEFTSRMVSQMGVAVDRDVEASADRMRVTNKSELANLLRSTLRDPPSPTQLAAIVRALTHPLIMGEHPTLLGRYQQRFLRLAATAKREESRTRARLWVHAQIINAQREGKHDEAVRLFQDNLIWIGLPDHPLFQAASQTSSFTGRAVLVYPSIHIVTTLLPSLLLTTPSPLKKSIPAFVETYVADVPSYPPSLHPTSATFSVILREVAHHSGSLAALRTLRSMTTAGLEPGEAGYTAVLLALAGKRQTTHLWSLLNQAERDAVLSKRTYRGLVAVLVKTGLGKDAEKMFWRAREKLDREDVFDDLDLD
ncbi:hypothetical protein IAU60_006713 [Kwoniella sp. DSM 27419]